MKRLFAILLIITNLWGLVGCASAPSSTPSNPMDTSSVRVLTLKGPTGMGMAKMMQDTRDHYLPCRYFYTLMATPDEMKDQLLNLDFEAAALPLPLAAKLYHESGGAIAVAALTATGTLTVVEKDKTINTIADLKGRVIYVSGKNSLPDLVLRYLLKQHGINPDKDVSIKTVDTQSVLTAMLLGGKAEIAVMQEPYITELLSKDESLHFAVNLNDLWHKATGQPMVQGCLVFNRSFGERHPDIIKTFLDHYKISLTFATDHPKEAARIMERTGVVPTSVAAEAALSNCDMQYVSGSQMHSMLKSNLNLWFSFDPQVIGGSIPDENFYL